VVLPLSIAKISHQYEYQEINGWRIFKNLSWGMVEVLQMQIKWFLVIAITSVALGWVILAT
jgi:hypothetical protein